MHLVRFLPSGRSALVESGTTILDAAGRAGETLRAECGGRGACGRCLVRIVEGSVPEYRVLGRREGCAEAHACLTPVFGPLTVLPLREADLPKLVARAQNMGVEPLCDWAPWPIPPDPLVPPGRDTDLGIALDIGTTTLRLLAVRLADGVVVGEASCYNPQIVRGADVISRIVAAEKGLLPEMCSSVRQAIRTLIESATASEEHREAEVRAYVVAGNLTMIHLLLGADPSGIRRVPSEPRALRFPPVEARSLDWPGGSGPVVTLPAIGGWVGGDIIGGIVRSGFSRGSNDLTLYVDLGTNGEIALGGRDYALACACSAGPAFEGGGIRCGMRAERGAIDGARIDARTAALTLSVIGGGHPRGICGSGMITLANELLHAGWIERDGRLGDTLPRALRVDGEWGKAVSLWDGGRVALWERDLGSLVRAKAAIFAGIRSLVAALGGGARVDRAIVSGNFGRYLNLPAAIGIGLLPDLPLGCYSYVENGALEAASLGLLSTKFLDEVDAYLSKVTYLSLSDLPTYMDDFVGASFLPHTNPAVLKM